MLISSAQTMCSRATGGTSGLCRIGTGPKPQCRLPLVPECEPALCIPARRSTTGSTDRFLLDSARIYLNGTVTPTIKFTFNTEYDGVTNKIGVMDAVGRFEPSKKIQYLGRPHPASQRSRKPLRSLLRA